MCALQATPSKDKNGNRVRASGIILWYLGRAEGNCVVYGLPLLY